MKKLIICAAACICMISCKEEDKSKTTYVINSDSTSSGDTSSANYSSADTASASTPSAPVDSATMMKNWQAYMTPSEAHKVMTAWNGKWEGQVTMWHAPGAPPEVSKSTTVNKMIMGGRYQQSAHTGNMMGMPFEGLSTMGYDNAKKVFTSTWIDNMGTGTMIMEGPWDDATKTLSLAGKVVDPSAGTAAEVNVRETYKVIDENTHVMEMYGMKDGKEFKNMEIKFVRK